MATQRSIIPSSTSFPHVLLIDTRSKPYQLPAIERIAVGRATAKKLCLSRGAEVSTYKKAAYNKSVFMVDKGGMRYLTEEQWQKVQAQHQALNDALQSIAAQLRSLGSYESRLAQQTKYLGKFKHVQNPMTPTVIRAEDPDHERSFYELGEWQVPKCKRHSITKHTQKMVRLDKDKHSTSSMGIFCCPTDADWQTMQDLEAVAVEKSQELTAFIESLQRYTQRYGG